MTQQFAAGAIDRPRTPAQAPQPIEAPRPFWEPVERRARTSSQPERMAREESTMQAALWDRHRQVETLLGRRVPPSVMMTGQSAADGAGYMTDLDYEARLEAMRLEFPDQLSGVESRADLTSRLSGQPAVTYYDTPRGRAQAVTRSDGSLWLETPEGFSGPLSRFPGARPVRRASAADVTQGDGSTASPRVRSLGERFTSTVEDAANSNPTMALGRWAAGGGYDQFEDPETGQALRFASFGQQARDLEDERRDAYRLMAESDAWDGGDASALHKLARGAATLGGVFAGGGADPLNMISPGRTVAGRIIGGVAVNAAGDAVTQGADIASGIEAEYRPLQTLAAAGVGAVVHGGLEAVGAAGRALDRDPGGVVSALASEIDAGSRTASDAPIPPAVRAALARIDGDRLDVARVGPVDGATHQAAVDAMTDLRSPLPANPVIARDIDELIASAPTPTQRGLTPAETKMLAGETTPAGPTPDAPSRPTAAQPAGQEAFEYQGRPVTSGAFDPMQVEADPAQFQYKASGDEGLTDRLAGVTSWDRTAAGRSILFEDRDGRTIVADGHQRRGLARRLIQSGEDPSATLDGLLFRQADGWEPGEVRVIAAMKNIREGAGSILDAAKVFREAPALINDRSLPLTGEFIANARGLARLSDDAFGAVANGVIPDRYGAVIGDLAADRMDLHLSMVDLMREADPRSLDEARALVQESRLADWATTNGLQTDMFGGVPAQSTLIARARLRAAVLKQLRTDAKLFGALIRNADAIEAGGNALARTANEQRLARDLAASAAVDRLSLRVGQVGDTFGEAASSVARGDMTNAQGVRAIIDELRAATELGDQTDALRRVTLTPDRPSDMAMRSLRPFDEPGGRGQTEQIQPKPEDVEAEARTAALWDDLPEIGDEQRALDVLNVCAPGRA
ncbi:hypothetical protein [Brevundimonas sp.]|uniref:hypothetical protein n=1 Tax=Brevundimonas sp. TaxID=1871086 RepID=UPI003BAAB9E2